MMSNRLALIGLTLFTTVLFADGDIRTATQWQKQVYVGVEGGFSVSTVMNFQPDYTVAANSAWGVLEHSIFNSDMNTSGLVGSVIGYKVNPNIRAELNYSYRGSFEWSRNSPLLFTDL